MSSVQPTLGTDRRLASMDVQPVVHGSVSAEELAPVGLRPQDVLDFSVSTNPLGPAPTVLDAIRSTDWTRYPGDDARPLRRALAERNGLSADQIVLGNGSAELLWLIGLATLQPGDTVSIQEPTFGEYARVAQIFGANVMTDRSNCRLTFICNPNNPTGTYLSEAEIDCRRDGLVVLDEAYVGFVAHRWPSERLLRESSNTVITRSFTKDQGLPGLRLGYLLASPALARRIESIRPPWNVNSGALRAGLAALEPEAEEHLARARACVAESRRLLSDGFRSLGYEVQPSATNFLLIRVGDARAFRRRLVQERMIVRDCTSFGLPAHIRVACRLPTECEQLLEAVTRVRDRPLDGAEAARWVGE